LAAVAQVLHPDTLTQTAQELAINQRKAQVAKAQTKAAAQGEETPYMVRAQCNWEDFSMLAGQRYVNVHNQCSRVLWHRLTDAEDGVGLEGVEGGEGLENALK
jgi:hypothetical protein